MLGFLFLGPSIEDFLQQTSTCSKCRSRDVLFKKNKKPRSNSTLHVLCKSCKTESSFSPAAPWNMNGKFSQHTAITALLFCITYFQGLGFLEVSIYLILIIFF